MKNIILDGKKIISKETFHKLIKAELELPDYYGENLDALWDVLSQEIEGGFMITWRDFKVSEEYLGDYAKNIIQLFDDLKIELPEFDYELK